MKVSELYTETIAVLKMGGCENAEFETVCLLEDIGGIGRGKIPFCMSQELLQEQCDPVLLAAQKRVNGEPLQYLLGNWDFLGLTLRVGEGVLIPRPETELLCQTVSDILYQKKKGSHVTVWDLCAGTGCVGLGVAFLYPNCETLELELSQEASVYLQKNIDAYPQIAAKAVYADILKDFDKFDTKVDVIVSNPPYIPTDDLSGLQREVQREPTLALDGGNDGYRFYRAIAENWITKLSADGIVAVEVGIGQADTVAELFCKAGLRNVRCIKDFASIDRIVVGEK